MKTGKASISPSAILIFLIMAVVAATYFLNPFSNVLSWDVFGYYLYLPSLFIYDDYALRDLSWLQAVVDSYHNTDPICQITTLENGNSVMVYSMGLAIMHAPAFLIAHGFVTMTGGVADGFSMPYQVAMIISGQVFSLAGLWFARKVLLYFFKEGLACIVLLLIVFGTNYFHTTVYGGNMPHNTLFTLLALMVWAIIKWEEQGKAGFIILIGLCGGFITLIRPTEIIVFLLPLLWGVSSLPSMKAHWQLIVKRRKQLVLFFAAIILAGLPQLIYWKLVAGSFFYYSHPAGVGLFFDAPHLTEVLVGFRKGWLIYTPIMTFALAGFIALYKKQRNLFLPILVYTVVNIYLVSCWSCWWYGGGDFSQRALVSSYAVLMLPLGFLIQRLKSAVLKGLLAVVFVGLIALNLFQTWQFHHGILSGERMTRHYYMNSFGKTSISESDNQWLLIDRNPLQGDVIIDETRFEKSQLACFNYDTVGEKDSECYVPDTSFNGNYVFALNGDHQFSPGATLLYKEIVDGEYAFIRASVYVFIPEGYSEVLPLLSSNFQHGKTSFFYTDKTVNRDSIRYNAWNYIETTYLTPEVVSHNDKLSIGVWHRGTSRILVDQLKVEVFRPLTDH